MKRKIGANPSDFECVFDYKGKKVALFSMGDYKDICIEAIIRYSDSDTLILAYSNRYKRSLSALIKRYQQHVVISKTPYNSADVESIISNI